jgi:hypothetical protein
VPGQLSLAQSLLNAKLPHPLTEFEGQPGGIVSVCRTRLGHPPVAQLLPIRLLRHRHHSSPSSSAVCSATLAIQVEP